MTTTRTLGMPMQGRRPRRGRRHRLVRGVRRGHWRLLPWSHEKRLYRGRRAGAQCACLPLRAALGASTAMIPSLAGNALEWAYFWRVHVDHIYRRRPAGRCPPVAGAPASGSGFPRAGWPHWSRSSCCVCLRLKPRSGHELPLPWSSPLLQAGPLRAAALRENHQQQDRSSKLWAFNLSKKKKAVGLLARQEPLRRLLRCWLPMLI
jgi:hypothetical protein